MFTESRILILHITIMENLTITYLGPKHTQNISTQKESSLFIDIAESSSLPAEAAGMCKESLLEEGTHHFFGSLLARLVVWWSGHGQLPSSIVTAYFTMNLASSQNIDMHQFCSMRALL